jgi:hypothetical protein
MEHIKDTKWFTVTQNLEYVNAILQGFRTGKYKANINGYTTPYAILILHME